MAMLPEINVLSHPTATAPRRDSRPLPVSHFVPPTTSGQAASPNAVPNYVLRRVAVAIAVVATTIVSVVGMGSAGAERSIADESVEVSSLVADDVSETPDVSDTTTVIVQPGDTLWTIAERVAPNVDRREAVDELAKIAGGSLLEVGQRLELPSSIFG